MNLVWLLIEGNLVHVWSINEGNQKTQIKKKPYLTLSIIFLIFYE